MPVSDKIHQLEEQIRQRIEHSLGELREEILGRFRSQSDQLRQQLEGLSVGLPEGLLRETDLDPVLRELSEEAIEKARLEQAVREPAPPAATAPAPGIREALVAFDRARSQSELLQALLGQCGKLATRAAVFLAQPGRLKGWGGQGLGGGEASLREMVVDAPPDTAWGRLLAGHGVVRLSTTERAHLPSRLEVPLPREAVLVPLVLRDRIAGALYADRVEENGSLPVESLQTLTYVAALALETLPLRQRESTATLEVEPGDETPSAEPAAAAPAVVEPVSAEPSPAAPSPPTPSPAAPPAPVEEPVAAAPETATAPPLPAAPPAEAPQVGAMEEVEVSPTEMAEVEMADMDLGEIDLGADDEEMSLGEAPTPATGPETADVGALMGRDKPPAASGWTLEEVSEPESAAASEVAEPPRPPVTAAPAPPPETMRFPTPLAPPVPPDEMPAATPTPIGDTRPGTEPGTPSSPLAAGGGATGAEVAPPSDVQGPGWAFSSAEELDGDEEARHDEAKRLARLLVSEIKLYNEEHVLEGRRNNDIFERLKEDIERSRQLYDSRVDERVREKTDYFYQEMVRVLGAGDPKTLGI